MKKIKTFAGFVNESLKNVNEGKLPSNITDWLKDVATSEQASAAKKVATWAEKAGSRISGGTSIGKSPQSLVLDVKYQGSEIHINADGRIRFQGKEVDNAGEFAEELDAYKRSSEANKKYFKISESVNISPEFKTKLDAFLDHPWQEDKEIEFVELLSQNRRTMYGASEKQSRDYITRLAKQLTGAHLSMVSDKFMSDLTELENPETDI